MDHFGIGAAIQGSVRCVLIAGRRSGRTTSLVESLKDGDRVIFLDPREASRVKKLCLERGVKIESLVTELCEPDSLLQCGTGQGRTLFDHAWVEQYYLKAIERAQAEIDFVQQALSGYGPAHRETRRRAEEMARWQL
jgi:hypothetical protein